MRRATAVSTAPSVPRRPPARLSLRTSAPVVFHPLVPCVEVRHRPSISPPPTEIGSPGRQRRLSPVYRCCQGVTIAFRPTQSSRHVGNQVNVWKQSPGASTAASPDGASAGGTSPPRDAGSAPAPRPSRGRFRPSLTTRAPSAAGCRRKTDPLAASPHLAANVHSGLPDVEFLFRPSPASVPAVEARRCERILDSPEPRLANFGVLRAICSRKSLPNVSPVKSRPVNRSGCRTSGGRTWRYRIELKTR